jgi:hypothetical protein
MPIKKFSKSSLIFDNQTVETNDGSDIPSPATTSAGRTVVTKTFTSNGTFFPPRNFTNVEILLVGSGGGGGNASGMTIGGGGGGGQVLYLASYLVKGLTPVTVTIGGQSSAQSKGGDTTFGELIAVGGNGGGGSGGAPTHNGFNGSGGGRGTGVAGLANGGFRGGLGYGNGTYSRGGGGAGAGADERSGMLEAAADGHLDGGIPVCGGRQQARAARCSGGGRRGRTAVGSEAAHGSIRWAGRRRQQQQLWRQRQGQ